VDMEEVYQSETSPTIPSSATPRAAPALAGFTVAVSHRSKHNGEWQDVNDGFFRCTAWRSVAENAARTLKKGMRVFVAGKLVQRTWQDDAGNKRQSVEIQVTHVGPDLQFATAEVTKSTAEGLKSSSDGPSAASSAEEKQRQ
jgi:single-strand DNA-binding protein